MAKLPRVTNKRFGSNIDINNIGQFGSVASGTKLNTKDVTTIQSLPAWLEGWTKATMSNNKYPTMQERNGLDYVHAYQIDYMLRAGMPEYDSQTEYDDTSIVKAIEDDKVVFYHSIINNNIGQSLDNTAAWEKVDLGGSRNIGEIVNSIIPLTDASLHLLDGALIQYGSYSEFVDYIAGLVTDYPDLFVTENDWQTAVATYGVCGKFVYDSVNNTVRLPKITGIVEGTTDLNALGDLVKAGLPNIKSGIALVVKNSNSSDGPYITGKGFYTSGVNWRKNTPNDNSSGLWGETVVNIDASLSNPIYGNSNTVQPQTIKVLYYIVIATTAKTDIEVDIDEIATDLNNKADVDGSNMVSSVKNFDGAWVESSLTAFSNVTLTTTPRTVDLSSYLPNDGYDYLVCATVLGKPNTAGIIAVVLGDYNTQIRTRGAVQNVNSESSGYIVVGNDRTVYCDTITGTWTSAELRFFAYRRIGTNQ